MQFVEHRRNADMHIVQKILDLLKKIGLLRVSGSTGTYKSAKDSGYKPPQSF